MGTYAFDPDWVIKPGETLREMLDDAGLKGDMGVRFAAKLSGLTVKQIEGILSGKQRITPRIAEQLAVGTQPLAISAQFWLNLEHAYRRGLASGKKEFDTSALVLAATLRMVAEDGRAGMWILALPMRTRRVFPLVSRTHRSNPGRRRHRRLAEEVPLAHISAPVWFDQSSPMSEVVDGNSEVHARPVDRGARSEKALGRAP